MGWERITPKQIVAIMREAECGPVRPALFRLHPMCEQTSFRWMGKDWGLVAGTMMNEDHLILIPGIDGESFSIAENLVKQNKP